MPDRVVADDRRDSWRAWNPRRPSTPPWLKMLWALVAQLPDGSQSEVYGLMGKREARGGGDVVGEARVGDVVIGRGQPAFGRQTS